MIFSQFSASGSYSMEGADSNEANDIVNQIESPHQQSSNAEDQTTDIEDGHPPNLLPSTEPDPSSNPMVEGNNGEIVQIDPLEYALFELGEGNARAARAIRSCISFNE